LQSRFQPAQEINQEAKIIASKLKRDDRIETYPNRNAFIMLKDHKKNFIDYPKCRLLNSAKSEIGKVSKIHLDEINCNIREKTKPINGGLLLR